MRKGPAILALATALLVATGMASATAPAKKHKLPKDVCALVSDEQAAGLVPEPIAEPEERTPQTVGCHWKNESTDIDVALNTLDVRVLSIPVSPAQIRQSFKVEAKDNDADIIKGLGSFAFQQSVIPPNTEVQALVGKFVLTVEFSGNGAVTDDEKAKTLAVARAVAKEI